MITKDEINEITNEITNFLNKNLGDHKNNIVKGDLQKCVFFAVMLKSLTNKAYNTLSKHCNEAQLKACEDLVNHIVTNQISEISIIKENDKNG